jgi:pimeloyl-ACP methyl ester carboxylesterase
VTADDVAALIETLNLDRPSIFGYSDGAQIALELAMRYPGLTRALVVGAAFYDLTESILGVYRSFGLNGPGDANFAQIETAMPEWVAAWRTDHFRADDPEYWRTLLTPISVMWYTPLGYSAGDFQKITEPTLMLCGDRDGFVPVEQSFDMYRMTPNAALAILPNTTHFSLINPPCIEIVLDCLLRHSAASEQG